MTDTIAMSRRSHQVTAGRCSRSESQDIKKVGGSNRRSRSAPANPTGGLMDRVGDADTGTRSATRCTRTMCAPPRTAAVTAAAVAQSRSAAGSGPVAAVRNDLRDGPTSSGRPSAARRVEPPGRQNCAPDCFAKPRPGIEDQPIPTIPKPSARSTRRCSSPHHLDDHIVIAGFLYMSRRPAAHVHQHDGHAAGGKQRSQSAGRSPGR